MPAERRDARATCAGTRPDVVVLTSLTYSRSQQLDLLKAARALRHSGGGGHHELGSPVEQGAAARRPRRVLVWNEVQQHEAVDDARRAGRRAWWSPARSATTSGSRARRSAAREAFCRAMGLRADRPFVLWVHSALSPTPEPPEPQLVARWIDALRAQPGPAAARAGRAGAPASRAAEGVGGHRPRRLRQRGVPRPEPDRSRLHATTTSTRCTTAAAVVGLVTSAFLEAAIVGRPVLTFTLPEYRMHQDEMIHFRYLTTVAGGLLHDGAGPRQRTLAQLAEAVALDGAARRAQPPLRAAPSSGRPASTCRRRRLFADAIEQAGARRGPAATRRLPGGAWMRPRRWPWRRASRTGVGRWLMNDRRTDDVGRARAMHRAHGRGAHRGQGGLARQRCAARRQQTRDRWMVAARQAGQEPHARGHGIALGRRPRGACSAHLRGIARPQVNGREARTVTQERQGTG